MPDVSIIVPTYREADNLESLCERIHEVMTREQLSYELIVADDNSPDGTAAVADEMSRRFPVRLLQPEGRARDLSLSVIDGLTAAKSDVLVVMDADLSHPAEKIPELVSSLTETGVFAIGSRYVSGGRFDRGWSFWRFLNSRMATLLSMPLVRCGDPMSGFFALRREDLPIASDLRPVGYKIALELMVRGNFKRIAEVPITFTDRTAGASKMNMGQQLNYLRHLRRLYLFRFGGFAEFVHYGAVGVSGFIVDICCYYLLQIVGLDHRVARGLSFWPAVSWNWALNRITTFGERERRPKGRQWAEFVLTSLIGFSLNWGVYVFLTSSFVFFDSYRILALMAGIVCASMFNFLGATFYVYSEKRD